MKTIRTRDNDRNACAELTPRGIVRGEGGGAVPNSIFKLCCFTQANNDIHTLDESKTGICSYDVWLYQVPIVVIVERKILVRPCSNGDVLTSVGSFTAIEMCTVQPYRVDEKEHACWATQ